MIGPDVRKCRKIPKCYNLQASQCLYQNAGNPSKSSLNNFVSPRTQKYQHGHMKGYNRGFPKVLHELENINMCAKHC